MTHKYLIFYLSTVILLLPKFSYAEADEKYKYDEQGRIIEMTSSDYKYTYSYDSNGWRTETSYACSNGSCQINPISKSVYDSDGDNRSSTTYTSVNGQYIIDDPHENIHSYYESTSNGIRTKIECKSTSDCNENTQNADIKKKYTYQTDFSGNITKTEYSNNGFGTIQLTTVYTYDSNGNKTSQTGYLQCQNEACDGGRIGRKAEYTYDSKGNLLSETVYETCANFICNDGNIKYKNEYFYEATEDGGMKQITTRYDCLNQQCTQTESLVSYIYDKYGNVIYERAEDAIYAYEYADKYGNIKTKKILYCDDYDDYETADEYCMNMYQTADWNDAWIESHTYDPAYLHNKWLQNRKLIYTVEEAAAVVKPDRNTFKIRYR